MKTIPELAVGVVGAALLGTIAGVTSPTTAYAVADVPSGQYQVTYDVPGAQDETWTFSPCGSYCTAGNNVGSDSAETGPHNWQFHLSNGRWTYHDEKPFECPYPGTEHNQKFVVDVSFDAVALAGRWIFHTSSVCNPEPDAEDYPFQLTKLD